MNPIREAFETIKAADRDMDAKTKIKVPKASVWTIRAGLLAAIIVFIAAVVQLGTTTQLGIRCPASAGWAGCENPFYTNQTVCTGGDLYCQPRVANGTCLGPACDEARSEKFVFYRNLILSISAFTAAAAIIAGILSPKQKGERV